MIEKFFNVRGQETEEHWVSISDVMAGLMVIFLFIAISYMVNANRKTERITALRDKIEKLVDAYRNLQEHLAKDLQDEFEADLAKEKWKGYLDMETLSIRFKKPFPPGEANVPEPFKSVLSKFFPRYIAILTKPKYRDEIDEIRIEGHTSSEWMGESKLEKDYSEEDAAYLENMELSQNRARNVLQYVLRINRPEMTQNKKWIKKNLTANGLSSSKPIPNSDGKENKEESRRVEFRVVTKSEKLIDEIKELMEEFDKEGEIN
ncbi:MAG: OmpA family protein [Candidatus Poribacteria bacterium]|nr:OmpA family protein [Candidatus Poribacteria bacterium]